MRIYAHIFCFFKGKTILCPEGSPFRVRHNFLTSLLSPPLEKGLNKRTPRTYDGPRVP